MKFMKEFARKQRKLKGQNPLFKNIKRLNYTHLKTSLYRVKSMQAELNQKIEYLMILNQAMGSH